ncbi:hypothetical protein TorRG33x02_132670, partial [Trema orientale]
CPDFFQTRNGMKAHQDRDHRKYSFLRCNSCKFILANEEDLKNHYCKALKKKK